MHLVVICAIPPQRLVAMPSTMRSLRPGELPAKQQVEDDPELDH